MRTPIPQITPWMRRIKIFFRRVLLLTLFASSLMVSTHQSALVPNATAADPPNRDKPGLQDLAQGGTLLRIQLANSSFEDGTDAPNNWTTLTQYIGDHYVWDTSVASVGQRSIATRGTSFRYGRWLSEAIDVQKAGFSFYSLTGSVKTIRNNGEVYLSIAWLDKNGYLITTSDSPMLPEGDNDWQQITVNALPPDGTVSVSVWCISNHNDGRTWYDDLKLTVTQFPAVGHKSSDQFLAEHPSHPLALAAHLMRVRALMTQAKWIKEKGFYDPAEQKRAAQLYAQAAAIQRNDSVLAKAAAAAGKTLSEEQVRFEALIDKALWEAAITAAASNDKEKVREYLSQIVTRNKDAELKAAAQKWIQEIDRQTESKTQNNQK